MQRLVKILLVEDDLLDQMEVKRTLERKNILYRMKVAHNGEEAVKILNDSTYDDIFRGKPHYAETISSPRLLSNRFNKSIG